MHGRFRNVLPKMHGSVHTVLYGLNSGFPLNLLPLDFYIKGILFTIFIMQEKQQNKLLDIEWKSS